MQVKLLHMERYCHIVHNYQPYLVSPNLSCQKKSTNKVWSKLASLGDIIVCDKIILKRKITVKCVQLYN